VRPASFGFIRTRPRHSCFQREITDVSRKEIERRARIEFDLLAGRLREAGADVIIVDDKEELNTPDAVFPNNWVSFHHDGTVVLYPMLAPSRRPERRRDIIDKLQSVGFVCRELSISPIMKMTTGSWRELEASFSITPITSRTRTFRRAPIQMS